MNDKIEKPDCCDEFHLMYLDQLRERGQVNMFGAGKWLEEIFGLSKEDAKAILVYWMKVFAYRHGENRRMK